MFRMPSNNKTAKTGGTLENDRNTRKSVGGRLCRLWRTVSGWPLQPSSNRQKNKTTACKQTKEKLKKIFSTHGIPRRLESDNGPPFNSIDFANFAIEEGFEHHKITPLHPRANGAAEAFMKVLNKTEQIANLQNKDSATAIQEMLIAYRCTPHPATDISPYEALMKRKVRTKLGYIQRKHNDREITEEKKINERENVTRRKSDTKLRTGTLENMILKLEITYC